MPMSRTATGRGAGYGPFDGEYYDESEEVEGRGLVVLWTGKTVEKEYENTTGITRLVFTDGSVADVDNPRVSNAGPGNLAIIDRDGKILAK